MSQYDPNATESGGSFFGDLFSTVTDGFGQFLTYQDQRDQRRIEARNGQPPPPPPPPVRGQPFGLDGYQRWGLFIGIASVAIALIALILKK